MPHTNGKLGPAGRRELVQLMIEEEMSERRAAACLSVSACTAHRWKTRWLQATDAQRRSGAWACDRSSRPHRSPRRTPAAVERNVLDAFHALDARTRRRVRALAPEVAAFLTADAAAIKEVERMTPLTDRGAGRFLSPLSEPE